MKILKIIGIIIIVIVVVIGITGMMLSGEASMERSIVINSPIEKVYTQVNTFSNIFEWSPWTKIDPNMKTSYSGPESGIGAKYDWESEDPNVGIGSQEIIENRENEYVKTRMTFGIPGEFYAEFKLSPEGDGTNVIWTYEGKTGSFLWKFLMLGIDAQLGPAYEQGLIDLKKYIEGLPDPAPVIEEVMVEEEVVDQ